MQFTLSNVLLSVLGVVTTGLIIEFVRKFKKVPDRKTKPKYKDYPKEFDPFILRNYWYPVAFFDEVTKDKPFATKLFGEPLVLYRNDDNSVTCLVDRCPHRNAALSGGILVKGKGIECPYHGWTFGNEGKCTSIPSTKPDSKMNELVCASSKPVREVMGLIWIWPNDATAKTLAHDTPIPSSLLNHHYEPENWVYNRFSAIVNVNYKILTENNLDHAHIYFVHDKTIEKRQNAHYIKCDKVEEKAEENPFGFAFNSYLPLKDTKVKNIELRFIPPCMINNNITFTNGFHMDELIIIVPLDKNETRDINLFYRDFVKFNQAFNSHTWIERYFYNASNRILAQDVRVIETVNKNVVERKAKPYQYTVSADMPVMAYRKFIEEAEKREDPWFKGFTVQSVDIEDIVSK